MKLGILHCLLNSGISASWISKKIVNPLNSINLSGDSGLINGVQPVIYEMVYNLIDNSIKYNVQNGGTGLGLSIVKHAAKYHEASIIVNSEVGKGSTFTVIFTV